MLTRNILEKFDNRPVTKKISLLCIFCLLISFCGFLNKALAGSNVDSAFDFRSFQDPTQPPSKAAKQSSTKEQPAPQYVLTAIFNRSSQTYAVINGNILTVGDFLADIQVVDIKETSVVIRDPSSSQTQKDVVLELNSSVSVKKQVSQ